MECLPQNKSAGEITILILKLELIQISFFHVKK